MNTTASTGNTKPVTLEDISKAMSEIELLIKPDQWLIIDPKGKVYKGTYDQVMLIMLAQHPLLKIR